MQKFCKGLPLINIKFLCTGYNKSGLEFKRECKSLFKIDNLNI